jgi:uncharacterized RmlC-like cupin family protein
MDWQHNGVKIVPAGDLDPNTPQTPGMTRAAAITHARTGANKLWAGTVVVQPNAKTGPHHHGDLETVLYIVRGRARMRWGDRLEFIGEAGPGDSSMFRHIWPTRRSTLLRTNLARPSWYEAGRIPSWSILTSKARNPAVLRAAHPLSIQTPSWTSSTKLAILRSIGTLDRRCVGKGPRVFR